MPARSFLPLLLILLSGCHGGADFAEVGSTTPAPDVEPVVKTEAEWRQQLSPLAFHVLRQGGTERAFSSPLNAEKRRGTYACAGCGLELFDSRTKFESGTGWPSFTEPIARGHVLNRRDTSGGMIRTENVCARCGGHLGHVFSDGPPPTGLRYCMNGAALTFVPAR